MTECDNISKESARGCGQGVNVQEETREGCLMEIKERREKGEAVTGENSASSVHRNVVKKENCIRDADGSGGEDSLLFHIFGDGLAKRIMSISEI